MLFAIKLAATLCIFYYKFLIKTNNPYFKFKYQNWSLRRTNFSTIFQSLLFWFYKYIPKFKKSETNRQLLRLQKEREKETLN